MLRRLRHALWTLGLVSDRCSWCGGELVERRTLGQGTRYICPDADCRFNE